MAKNSPVQSYAVLKLASFLGWPVTNITKSANMENFDTIGKSIRDQKHKKNSCLKINLSKVMRC